MMPIIDRAWSKVDKRGADECWPWVGASNKKGQGHLSVGRRGEGFTFGYRVIYEHTNGPIPDGQDVCHTCDNPPCCNPSHLFAATHKINMIDMASKERSPRRELTRDEVLKIRAIFASGGVTKAALGGAFGVSRVQIANIVTRRHWVWC